jgi:hypothetical protein
MLAAATPDVLAVTASVASSPSAAAGTALAAADAGTLCPSNASIAVAASGVAEADVSSFRPDFPFCPDGDDACDFACACFACVGCDVSLCCASW